MLSTGCRKAFSGIFRYGDKDFRLIENMNPNLLTEFFFDIRHSTNASEYADITAAVRGIREPRKFFFVSCDYLDPEHVIIRTYPKLEDFDWDDQVQINNLNLFREAAITEACGVITFGEDGIILPSSQMISRLTARPLQNKRKADAIMEGSDQGKQNSTDSSTNPEMESRALAPDSVQSVTKALQALPNVQLKPTAQPCQPASSRLEPTATPYTYNPADFAIDGVPFQPSPALLERIRNTGYWGADWRTLQFGSPMANERESASLQHIHQNYNRTVFSRPIRYPDLHQMHNQGSRLQQYSQESHNLFQTHGSGPGQQHHQQRYEMPQYNPPRSPHIYQAQEYGMHRQIHGQQEHSVQNDEYGSQHIRQQAHNPTFQEDAMQQTHGQGYTSFQNQSMRSPYTGGHQSFYNARMPVYGTPQYAYRPSDQIQSLDLAEVQQLYQQRQNLDSVRPRQHGQQSHIRLSSPNYPQQASSQYQQRGVSASNVENTSSQIPSGSVSNQHDQNNTVGAGGGGEIVQNALNSMSAEDLADAFEDADITLSDFLHM